MEFGPRALGCRSILGDARAPKMQSVMNLKIKFRESFRPFAPIVLAGAGAASTSRSRAGHESPYMLLVAPVDRGEAPSPTRRAQPRLGHREAQVAALGDPGGHPRRLLGPRPDRRRASATAATTSCSRRFEEQTGCPVLINTSFNVRGEPIVCTPEDAYRCFMATDMDVLVLERFVLLKADQPGAAEHPVDEYLAQFALD